ncbi:MAG: S-layer homology domain-containing protein, partial [Clostridia bacterium]|nr:S-layer homology domain-containing protein [Clostridia bacterium]
QSAFPDVPENSYFEAAVNWGNENGIVTGYQNGKFGVGDKVTREQLVTFLYRYAKYIGVDVTVDANAESKIATQFTDYNKVSSFSKDAIIWAIENGVITGKNPTTIAPQGNAQRCEVAKIMYNIFLNNIFN